LGFPVKDYVENLFCNVLFIGVGYIRSIKNA